MEILQAAALTHGAQLPCEDRIDLWLSNTQRTMERNDALGLAAAGAVVKAEVLRREVLMEHPA